MIRNLSKVLRGKATPRQIYLATLLGGCLGFVPGFFLISDLGGGLMQAPGLILSLVFLVLVLNANLAVFGMTLLGAKLASIALLPVSFAIGRVLLDGPTQGLFHALVNAPVFAWFGLERYATTGGLFLGLIVGGLCGFGFVRALHAFRARMASAEENSERYQKWSQKKSARFATWVFLGKGKGKKRTYRELLEEQKKGMPVRVAGVAVVAVVSILLWLGHAFLIGPAMRNALQVGLEDYNGATVDLLEASLDLAGGQAVIAGLAMADPNALTKDTFRARSLELKLGTRDLLKKRFVIDRIQSREASSGAKRERPGERVVRDATPPPPPPPKTEQEKTIEDYVKDAEAWRDRLVQVADWLEMLTGSGETGEESAEDRDVRIEEDKDRYGLARVVAHHLIDDAPLVLVRELVFEGVKAIDLDGDLLDIRATNLSTNPRLAEGPLEMSITARSGAFGFTFRYDPKQPDAATTSFAFKGIAVDSIAEQLSAAPIKGGTLDVAFEAALDCSRPDGIWVDAPLNVTLHDTTLSLEGLTETPIQILTVPLGLRGPLTGPRVSIDDAQLGDALIAAGQQELANQVKAQANQLLGGSIPGVGDELGKVIGGQKTPEQLLEEAKRKAAAEAKKKAEDELKNRASGALDNLFGGKKKTDK